MWVIICIHFFKLTGTGKHETEPKFTKVLYILYVHNQIKFKYTLILSCGNIPLRTGGQPKEY